MDMTGPSESTNNRRAGRVLLQAFGSDLGDVCDLSANGARILCKGSAPREGQELRFTIQGVDGGIEVVARVVWSKRRGWFRREVGIEFLELDPRTRKALSTLARTAAGVQGHSLDGPQRHVA